MELTRPEAVDLGEVAGINAVDGIKVQIHQRTARVVGWHRR